MMQSAVRNLQQVLKSNGLYTKKIDGRRGKNTDTAAKKFLASRQTELSEPSAGWTARRICIAAYQLILKDKKLPVGVVDGLWGSNTENAHEMFEETQEFGAPRFPRDIVINDTNPHGWPTYANITSVYGPHGVEGGFTPPLVRVPTPWRLKIAWDLSASRSTYRVHEAVADSLSTVVKNVFAHYGAARISELALDLFGGDYEARLMRGSNSKWSTHSWGVAIDYDPAHNKLSWNSSQARFAAPEYEAWWGYWEEEGWVSLGRTQNRDWMHVQAIKL